MKIKFLKAIYAVILCTVVVGFPSFLLWSTADDNKKIAQLQSENELLKTRVKQETDYIEVNSKFVFKETETVRHTLKDITVTSYNNHSSQTDTTPNITATNRPVREGIVAVSPDLLKKGTAHYGDLLYISCFDKWYLIEDTMNSRFERRVDVFLFDKQESLKINKKCDIEILHYTK